LARDLVGIFAGNGVREYIRLSATLSWSYVHVVKIYVGEGSLDLSCMLNPVLNSN
jgi:hypothetical protein